MPTLSRSRESLIRSLASRHGRKGSPYCLCDGPRASYEVLTLRPELVEEVILREGTSLPSGVSREPVVLSSAGFERLSITVHSQGILLLVRRPEKIVAEAPVIDPFAFVLDRIGDPGNFGTIIRTARAAGLRQVWMTGGSVDPYSDKAVRSASGAQFAVEVREHGSLEEVLALLGSKGFSRVYRTSPAAGRNVFTEEALFEKSVIVLGNEGAGVGGIPGALDLNIPMPGDAESLNVAQAATVILFEHVRRMSAAGARQHGLSE
ncbi:MAG: 23S rRNA (uridine(2479)-2'-O)-methyltransferase [Lentisphaerae bacterium ADurb.Bin242]|nr:MAG: 23S rRNA (uridine(2479)-2'-O)-methyltransferase [Lentisphaerae bacterium ADurb.Bin242]